MEFSSFPKNLAYAVKTLNSFSKSTVKLLPDNRTDTVTSGNIIRVRLPQNSIIDLRTFTMYYQGICSTANSTTGKGHYPRLSSSIIDTLTIYVNGTQIENIQNYNLLYNTLYDLDGGGIDQQAKRCLENVDPSVYYLITDNETSTATPQVTSHQAIDNSTVYRKFIINNWCGFLATCSTPCIDTNDLNEVIIEIRLATSDVCFLSCEPAGGVASTTGTVSSYTLKNIGFTISKIVFNDPLYYSLKASKLLGDGLTLGYNTYINTRGGQTAKSTSMNIYTNINTTSLNQVICVLQDPDNWGTGAGLAKNLLLNTATGDVSTIATNRKTFNEVLNGTLPAAAVLGDFFNQSPYFRRNGVGLTTSQLFINNTPITPQPLEPELIYNENLIALGNNHQDMGIGIHPGCVSLSHFLKYYFCAITSLENICPGESFYKTGLDGKASSLNLNWVCSFSTATDQVIPHIYCNCTRIMQVNEGHAITVIV
jgi:hypothetical protein